MSDCPFCKRIAAGDYGSNSSEPDVVWFEPLNPVTRGHMLFVPVHHVADALEDSLTTAITMETAAWWASMHREMWGWESCNLITSVGAEATQTVLHLHVHLVPRHEGDGLMLPWAPIQQAGG